MMLILNLASIDADPNYSNGNLAIDSSSVDVTTVGTYTVEYTADADGAGNDHLVRLEYCTKLFTIRLSPFVILFKIVAKSFYSRPANDLTSAL